MHADSSHVPPSARRPIPSLRSLKVVSYNILAPKYAGYNSYCPPQFLAWEYRRELIQRELDQHGADIAGLQECDMDFFNSELQGWMSQRGLQGEFLPRNVGPIPGPTEGIALLWRAASLELVKQRSLVYSEMDPLVAGLPAEVAASSPWSKLRELGEGVVMALLRHRPTGRLLVAAVTHLFWNPAFPDVKALQAALLCGSLAAFSREAAVAEAAGGDTAGGWGEPPLVLCGDFNSLAVKWLSDMFDPQVPPTGLVSGVYTLLSRGSLPPEHEDHPASRRWAGEEQPPAGAERFPAVPLTSSGLELASLNEEAFGREPPLTTRTASWAGCIDFVWLSRGRLAVASALSMPFDDGGTPPLGPQATTTTTTGGPGPQVPSCSGSAATPQGAAVGANAAGGDVAGTPSRRDGGPSWRDPLKDIDFTAIPDQFYPSDHLLVGGEVVLLPEAARRRT